MTLFDDRPATSDEATLARMGYEQELSRSFSPFANYALSFSIICILAGGITAFPAALGAGGGLSVAVGWAVGALFALLVALERHEHDVHFTRKVVREHQVAPLEVAHLDLWEQARRVRLRAHESRQAGNRHLQGGGEAEDGDGAHGGNR